MFADCGSALMKRGCRLEFIRLVWQSYPNIFAMLQEVGHIVFLQKLLMGLGWVQPVAFQPEKEDLGLAIYWFQTGRWSAKITSLGRRVYSAVFLEDLSIPFSGLDASACLTGLLLQQFSITTPVRRLTARLLRPQFLLLILSEFSIAIKVYRRIWPTTAPTAIFYCTPDATSRGLDFLDGDLLLIWLRRYWRAKRPYGPTSILIFHLYPLTYLFSPGPRRRPSRRDVFFFS